MSTKKPKAETKVRLELHVDSPFSTYSGKVSKVHEGVLRGRGTVYDCIKREIREAFGSLGIGCVVEVSLHGKFFVSVLPTYTVVMRSNGSKTVTASSRSVQFEYRKVPREEMRP